MEYTYIPTRIKRELVRFGMEDWWPFILVFLVSYPLWWHFSKTFMWCHLYHVFTYIYSLLIEKDICVCRNISVKLPCVHVGL